MPLSAAQSASKHSRQSTMLTISPWDFPSAEIATGLLTAVSFVIALASMLQAAIGGATLRRRDGISEVGGDRRRGRYSHIDAFLSGGRRACHARVGERTLTGMAGLELPGFAAALRYPRRAGSHPRGAGR